MSDSNSSNNTSTPQGELIATPESSSNAPATPQATALSADRAQLLQTARSFLNSPHVQHEGIDAKRNFLAQKGLNEEEIGQLLQTSVRMLFILSLFRVLR
jgi:hypothetical protein